MDCLIWAERMKHKNTANPEPGTGELDVYV